MVWKIYPGLVTPINPTPPDVIYNILQDENNPNFGALKMVATCVIPTLLLLPGEPDLHRQTVRNIGMLRTECDKYSTPMMIEPLAMKNNDVRGGYQSDGNKESMIPLVRQARELGTDIIKADPTDHPENYHEVIEVVRCPVLVRGGGNADLRTVFPNRYAFNQQGGKGFVYGCNAYKHSNPVLVTRALMAMLHNDATAKVTWGIYQSGQDLNG